VKKNVLALAHPTAPPSHISQPDPHLMSDIKLFRITNDTTTELPGAAYDLERPLQTLIEANLESLLGIHFLTSEHSTVCFRKNNLLLFLRLNADKHPNQPGFLRDVRNIGHWGTGDIKITLKNPNDLDKAKPLILEAYEGGNA
jgi:predicted transport protein